MKATPHTKGHRWTNAEIKALMMMWGKDASLDEIAAELGVSRFAINKMVGRLRKEGVPLALRNAGHKAGRRNAYWSQGEVEFLVRRRQERATVEQIALELQRSFLGVQGMIQKLRQSGVDVPMLGCGVRKRWDPELLKAAIAGQGVIRLEVEESAA